MATANPPADAASRVTAIEDRPVLPVDSSPVEQQSPPPAVPPAPAAPPPSDPFIGRRVGPYVIQRKLGEGGMGVVYLALDVNLQMPVAIKVPRPEYARDGEYRTRLIDEARAAAAVSHPNVAAVFQLLEEGDDLFVVYEYVDGPTLRSIINRGRLHYEQVVKLFPDIAKGLEAAHAKGIVHRDVKPENVMMTSADIPKIVDFGLAKRSRAITASSTRVTQVGGQSGTPAYMAPEQLEDTPARSLDFHVDHFAFGVMLYESASGIHPFAGSSWWTTRENIKHRDPPRLPQLDQDLSRLEAIIQRCLRKNPAERHASTKDLVRELESLPLSQDTPVVWEWWWRFHQLAVSGAYALTLAWLWAVQSLTQPPRVALGLFVVAIVAVVSDVALRLFLCWASLWGRSREFDESRAQLRPLVSGADWVLVGTLVVWAALLLVANSRPGTAVPIIVLAVVYLVIFNVVEPWTTHRAFPEGAGRQGGLAMVEIRSHPDGAELTVDGRFAGNLPSTVMLAPGEHEVLVELAGHRSWRRTLAVAAGGHVKIKAILEKEPQK